MLTLIDSRGLTFIEGRLYAQNLFGHNPKVKHISMTEFF